MGSDKSVGRGIGLILVVGIVLGLAHNAVGLASRPSRGIPWLAVPTTLTGLGDPGAGDSLSGGGNGPLAPPPAVATPEPGRGASDPGASTSGPAATTSDAGSSRPPSRGDQVPSTADPTPSAAPAPRGSSGPEAPPLVPEQGRPVEVDLATVKRFFDARAAVFVDARDAAEFEAGHIPGAARLTLNDALAEPERIRALAPGGRPIITYCEGGTCEASLDLARALVDAGYRRVLVYSGGFPEWSAAGHPVERGSGR